ncbi:PLAC8 family protein [Aspergillus heterothallicus]
MPSDWTQSFWAMPSCGLCYESCFCPCLLYGRTHERRKGNTEPSSVNTACLCFTFGCIAGLFPLILCIERGGIRKQYDIDGGVCGDFCGSVCCMGNVLIQSERETIARTAPPQQYQVVDPMRYGAQ